MQFIYPVDGYDPSGRANAIASLIPPQLNWEYSFTGTRALAPIEAFDNGQFTYFKFRRSGMSHYSAIFTVRIKNAVRLGQLSHARQLRVIHTVAKQFTLRDGDNVTSIYNDKAIVDWQSIH